MRMFMATDEECLQVFNSSQQYAFLNITIVIYIAVVGFPFLKEYPKV